MNPRRGSRRVVLAALAMWVVSTVSLHAATLTQVNTAIDAGLGYLSATQTAGGYWNYGGYERAATGAAAYAMLSQQSRWGAHAAEYQGKVDNAISYLLSTATKQTGTVSTRNDGTNICPAGAGNCDGVFWQAAGNENTYTTGLIAPAIALYGKRAPGAVATITGPLAGMTWRQIAQGINNTFAASQSTANQGVLRGGWRYYDGLPIYDSDMSTTQWAVVALSYGQSLGATTPAIVRSDLANFLGYTQHPWTGAGCYQGPASGLCDHSDTGGLLLGLSFIGKPASDPAVQAALGFLDRQWQQGPDSVWYGNFGHPYAMWSVYKGLETTIGLDDTTEIGNLLDPGCDGPSNSDTPPSACNWWLDYNDWLVRNQHADGGWGGYAYWTDPLATSFYLPILGGADIPDNDVPEPSGLMLFAVGIAALIATRRRSRVHA